MIDNAKIINNHVYSENKKNRDFNADTGKWKLALK